MSNDQLHDSLTIWLQRQVPEETARFIDKCLELGMDRHVLWRVMQSILRKAKAPVSSTIYRAIHAKIYPEVKEVPRYPAGW